MDAAPAAYEEEPSGPPAAPKAIPPRQPMRGQPKGIRRADAEGMELLDALAGRACLLGFGNAAIAEAIRSSAELYLGDAAALLDQPERGDDRLLNQLDQLLRQSGGVDVDSIFVSSSADMAIEVAIGMARTWKPDPVHRVITMVGSDHGRTAACRIASGRPSLHEGFGPMMAGFTHVPRGNFDALRASVDEQTAAIMLSPVDLANACQTLDGEFLNQTFASCATIRRLP